MTSPRSKRDKVEKLKAREEALAVEAKKAVAEKPKKLTRRKKEEQK
tara:strand:+ start:93 stop:230 length:138 start_codon:yes stop_codon:yes gene_type:complete